MPKKSHNRYTTIGSCTSETTVLVRELDERLGVGELIKRHLADLRGKNRQLPLVDLLRQSVYRLAGYEDMNDAEPLSQDPTFRLIGSRKIWAWGSVDLPLTVIRDGIPYASRQPRGSGRAQS